MAQTSSNTNVEMYNAITKEELEGAINRIKNNLKDDKDFTLSVIGCKETIYSYEKRPQIVIGRKRLYCSIVVRLHEEQLKYGDDYKLKIGFDASHFYCHNVHCVNKDHIYFENHKVNKSRLCCRIYGMTMINYKCPHLPLCGINEYTQIKI